MTTPDGSSSSSGDLAAYYERQFARTEAAAEVSIYGDLTVLLEAAHHRRMALLDALPVGDLSGATCVDYGVGSWGFANVYPRLHGAVKVIGLEISETALRLSEEVSSTGSFLYGDRFEYHLATAGPLPLDDGSVDVFFTGECIEHIENTDVFLDDIHRVLRPGGVLILTTPNADAVLYRAQGRRYAIGPEHVALMSLPELLAYLEPGFAVEVVKGYNTSLDEATDRLVQDPVAAAGIAALFEDAPEQASGVIVMARRRDVVRPQSYRQVVIEPGSVVVKRTGRWQPVPLHEGLAGLLSMGDPRDRLAFDVAGTDLLVFLWTHDWSGEVEVSVDGAVVATQSLYEWAGGFRRLHVDDLVAGNHHVVIRPTGHQSQLSHGSQVIVFRAIGYAAEAIASA